MLRRVAVTLVALARAAPWTPELAHDGTTPWDGPAMIRAELKRSVAAYAARTTAEDARKYAASLARHGDQLCVFLGGRLFVSDRFLDQSKHKKHARHPKRAQYCMQSAFNSVLKRQGLLKKKQRQNSRKSKKKANLTSKNMNGW